MGANQPGAAGGPVETLEAALARLSARGVALVKRSSWWGSAAWPDPAAPPFVNGVALVRTVLEPAALLALLHEVEAEFGRVRSVANAPRPLDLDLIAYGRRRSGVTPVLPHPRAAERAFVMGPLAEIAPGWRHPELGRTAAELVAAASVGRDAAPF